MKIRLWGTAGECRAAAESLMQAPGLTVVSISEPRADRGASVLVRVYVEARLGPLPATRAGDATDGDRLPARRALPPGGDR